MHNHNLVARFAKRISATFAQLFIVAALVFGLVVTIKAQAKTSATPYVLHQGVLFDQTQLLGREARAKRGSLVI